MSNIAGFPHVEVQFTKEGRVHDPAAVIQLLTALQQNSATDLFVFSHGWNNDIAEARTLNEAFFKCVRDVLDGGRVAGLNGRQFAILTILWPSKKFAEKDLIPSGAASASSVVSIDVLQAQLDELKGGAFDNPKADSILEQAKMLVPKLEDSPKARTDFADLIRSLVEQSTDNRGDASNAFFNLSGKELMDRLSKPVMPAAPVPATGQGGAASLGSMLKTGVGAVTGAVKAGVGAVGQFFSGVNSAARNLLNYTTYYQMKERAGLVGVTGVHEVLSKVREKFPTLKMHLIGHSFGGRLVTAAALGPNDQPSTIPSTMTLLQAAFSHNGFGQKFDNVNDGFFRRVITEKRIAGPILISHSVQDRAVGIAYPLASLIAGQNASALGDSNDPFGGIGRNGAQHTPEASNAFALADVGSPYAFAAGKLYNLNADMRITGHSDIAKNEVAYALLTAVATT